MSKIKVYVNGDKWLKESGYTKKLSKEEMKKIREEQGVDVLEEINFGYPPFSEHPLKEGEIYLPDKLDEEIGERLCDLLTLANPDTKKKYRPRSVNITLTVSDIEWYEGDYE